MIYGGVNLVGLIGPRASLADSCDPAARMARRIMSPETERRMRVLSNQRLAVVEESQDQYNVVPADESDEEATLTIEDLSLDEDNSTQVELVVDEHGLTLEIRNHDGTDRNLHLIFSDGSMETVIRSMVDLVSTLATINPSLLNKTNLRLK